MRLLIFFFAFSIVASAHAAERVALVIGNSAYEGISGLSNPKNDARAVSEALAKHGFEVLEQIDRKRTEMSEDLRRFRRAADNAEIALVYFAGHGIEVRGKNYLVPVDARMLDERDVENEAVSLDSVLAGISGARQLKMVVLDACRDNPFVHRMVRANGTRSVGRGLGRVNAERSNTLIAYAAAAGDVTPDGVPGQNSPFTAAFLEGLSSGPRDVRLMMGTVRDSLRRRIGQNVEPFIYASLGGDSIVINPGASSSDTAITSPPKDTASPSLVSTQPSQEIVPVAPTAAPQGDFQGVWQYSGYDWTIELTVDGSNVFLAATDSRGTMRGEGTIAEDGTIGLIPLGGGWADRDASGKLPNINISDSTVSDNGGDFRLTRSE